MPRYRRHYDETNYFHSGPLVAVSFIRRFYYPFFFVFEPITSHANLFTFPSVRSDYNSRAVDYGIHSYRLCRRNGTPTRLFYDSRHSLRRDVIRRA